MSFNRVSTGCEVALTFDNLGEAAEIELGLWPAKRPVGAHASVWEGWPAIREVLDRHAAQATFFVEGWNAEIYGEALREIEGHGHEIGCHGWRHEDWATLPLEVADAQADRALKELRKVVAECVGFPGGYLADGALEMLSRKGITYVSPVGEGLRVKAGITIIPFSWQAVDAVYVEPIMAHLRTRLFGKLDIFSPEAWSAVLNEQLDEALRSGSLLNVIFHSYLFAGHPERIAVLDDFVGRCAADSRVTISRCRDIASAFAR